MRTLRYSDAVRILGGDSAIVKALDRITGGLILTGAAAGGAPALLGLLAGRTEFIRLSHDLVRMASDRRHGLSRFTRTQRIEAAHAVLMMVAYFEALGEADLPFDLADLELTQDDQLRLMGAGRHRPTWLFSVVSVGGVSAPAQSHELRRSHLGFVYQRQSSGVADFVRSLAVWDRLTETDQGRFTRTLDGEVPERACDRYDELVRQLAVEFPEVAWWASLREHEATREEVRTVTGALSRIASLLEEVSTGAPPDQRRDGLARAYRAALGRPIVTSGDVPAGLSLPTLGTGYVSPRYRLTLVPPDAKLSDESWWEKVPVRDDLAELLTAHLTSSGATQAPLLVLGQPGSGKSVLTRVLAARLPPADFLPVRVVLREVPATADLQDQIEYAIRSDTGERIDWPALARSAGDALPVVILDGFDELLQATGVSQTDYLTRVAAFQEREHDQGRPVAVIVTSRTSVADRARVPDFAMALRLEPFDDHRVMAWLDIWNEVNADAFRARGVSPLVAEAVLAHRELAGQPLLLLMLALYDADGNALQQAGPDLQQGDLYERLLHSFARREVKKQGKGLPEQQLDQAVELELRRLSIVAFAMFNRGTQWVTQADLEADLPALLSERPPTTAMGPHDLRTPLRPAEIVLGRFFFVHRSQASRDDTQLETYEFLHATFGEFLVARLTWQVLQDLVARETAATMPFANTPANDDLLHALLSFAVLSQRGPILGFLSDLAAPLDASERGSTANLLVRLFRAAHEARAGRGYASYQPRRLPVPAQHAAYGANLVLLTICVLGWLRISQLYETVQDPVQAWKSEAMLWRSQLPASEWSSIVDSLYLERTRADGQRDIILKLHPFTPLEIDPYWSYGYDPENDQLPGAAWHPEQSAGNLMRTAHFLCRRGEDVALHALEPLLIHLGISVNTLVGWGRGRTTSAAHALLEAWLLPLRDPSVEEQHAVYGLCAEIAAHDFPHWDETTRVRYAALLLDRLTTDPSVPADLVADILGKFEDIPAELLPHIERCGQAFLGRDPASDERIEAAVRTSRGHLNIRT